MWVVQRGELLELPDDAPHPPNATVVELPDEFLDEPELFEVRARGVHRRPDDEVAAIRERRASGRLSADDIATIKTAIEEGRL
jgi:hypothetical protein